MTKKSSNTNDEDDDLMPVWGADEIAKIANVSKHVAFRLLESGELPGRKVGRRWVSNRRALRKRTHVEYVE